MKSVIEQLGDSASATNIPFLTALEVPVFISRLPEDKGSGRSSSFDLKCLEEIPDSFKQFRQTNKDNDALSPSIQTPTENRDRHIMINRLFNIQLRFPLAVIVEPDDKIFIARTPDLPLYAVGDDQIEAVDSLKREIESLYNDLMEDDEFTEEWLGVKKFLRKIVKDC